MGIMIRDLIPDKNYWVISDPHSDIPFKGPQRIKFIGVNHIEEDNRYWEGVGSYQYTMMFEKGIRIPLHDAGMKSGHRFTKGYYVSESSAHIFGVMTRIAWPEKFDIRPKDGFDYEWFRRYVDRFEKEHPELLI
jgi:hypothetical protein